MEASVSEIHRYPLRPEGFEEPLFSTRESRLAILDHLLRTPWLSRASEMEERGGQAAHARWEPVELENRHGRVRIAWSSGRRRCRKRRHVVEVLGRWREVRAWWDETRAKNRSLARLLLSDGSVVDLARENGGEWFLVGVTD
jgi:integrase